MSLINKMLLDLDARVEDVKELADPRPIVEDLRPANEPRLRRPRTLLALLALAALLALGGGAWLLAEHDPAPPPAVLPAPAVAPPAARVESGTAAPDAAAIPTAPAAVTAAPALDASRRAERGLPSTPAAGKRPAPPPETSAPAVAAPRAPAEQPVPPARGPDAPLLEKTLRAPSPAERAEAEYRAGLRDRGAQRLAEAEHHLRQALAHDPDHRPARETLAELLLQQGHWEDAKQILYEGIIVAPGHYRFTQRLARVHVEQGNEARAIALLESAQPHAAGDADYLGLLAVLYQRAGRHDEAIAAFRTALRLRPLEGKWWLALGISLETQREWRDARDAYLRVEAGVRVDAGLKEYARQRLARVLQALEETQ